MLNGAASTALHDDTLHGTRGTVPADQRSFTIDFRVYCLSEGKNCYNLHARMSEGDHEMQCLIEARGYLPQNGRTLWIIQLQEYAQMREEADWLVAYDFAWE